MAFVHIKLKNSPEKVGLGLLLKQMFGKKILQVVHVFKFLRDFPSILSACKINYCQCSETVYWSVCLFFFFAFVAFEAAYCNAVEIACTVFSTELILVVCLHALD